MNLINGQITVGEILQNQQAVALLQRELPQLFSLLHTPLGFAVRKMTLNQAIGKAGGYLSQAKIQNLLGRLQML